MKSDEVVKNKIQINRRIQTEYLMNNILDKDFQAMLFPLSCIRKTCKNVLRLNRASLRKMSAFGVFELDATFPLRLLSIIVTYVVVLLQFAFLT
ncbi:uncharacterized protein LOC134800650 [Cydia splendana]|uniref:uncharacterized protein LOC134800650 n=1 Tax=Cydia splendana TaxID=1100963 RepID=UPI00300D14C8